MRIIAGDWRGRRIEAGEGVRPTSDRVREALFSILGGRLDGLFIDCYAGTGAVGLEARSRGASVVLVERDPDALDVIRANVERLDAKGVRIVEGDVLRVLKRPDEAPRAPFGRPPAPASWIFADPPYDYGPMDKLLRTIARSPLTGPETVVVLERERGRAPRAEGLELTRAETYGTTVLSFFRLPSLSSASDSLDAVSESPS